MSGEVRENCWLNLRQLQENSDGKTKLVDGLHEARDVQEQFLFKLDNRSKMGKPDHASLFSGKVPKVAPVPI